MGGETVSNPMKMIIYNDNLVDVVHVIVSDLYDVSPECVKLTIKEFLFQAAQQVRRGNTMDLEHFGCFNQFEADVGGAVTIDFTPDPGLKAGERYKGVAE